MSRPSITSAKTSFPIYSASWGHGSRSQYLVVGGGGGSGAHGVKNMISCFDLSSRAPTIEACAELEVSKDDSVTSLANLATKDGLILFAGNGSSVEERLKGQDMHFKAFEAQLPKGKAATLSFLSKTQLFTPPKADIAKKEIYQRILKLSPPQRTASAVPNKRIGAIASGLAGDENEIVIFSATSNRPQAQDIITRIKLSAGHEANDLDICDQGEGRFQVAYCLDSDVYIQDIDYDFTQSKSRSTSERRKVYTVPHPDASERKGRSKLRGIRWLSPKHLLLLSNKHNRTGVELLLLHMYEEGPGSIVTRKTLPSHVKAATDFDVALLDADADGAYQIVVAVGGIDISLSIYTIDYHGPAQDSLSRLHKYATYDDVCFSAGAYCMLLTETRSIQCK
jgi:prolactin regulatory element-binding protein